MSGNKNNSILFATFILSAFNSIISFIFANDIVKQFLGIKFLSSIKSVMNNNLFVILLSYIILCCFIWYFIKALSYIIVDKTVYKYNIYICIALFAILSLLRIITLFKFSTEAFILKIFISIFIFSIGLFITLLLCTKKSNIVLKTITMIKEINEPKFKIIYFFNLICFLIPIYFFMIFLFVNMMGIEFIKIIHTIFN